MRPLQELFKSEDHPDLLVGLGVPDDAAVWRLDDERSLVVTTDFFTPVVDSGYEYGAIAAANALSDLYAMGASPFMALNIAAMPVDLPPEIVASIFRGAAEKVKEAGAVVAGGHSIQDDEPKFGLVALGLVRSAQLMTKGQARPGDVLVLTKPLGTGVTSTALKQGKARAADVEEAIAWMSALNRRGAELALAHGVRAATDVTGYGLLGHGFEMAQASGVSLELYLGSVPLLQGARHYAQSGIAPGGSRDNMSYFGQHVEFEAGIDATARMILFDAQTSGGLLLALPASRLEPFLAAARQESLACWVIGQVRAGSGIRVLDRVWEGQRPESSAQAAFLPVQGS